MTNFKNGNTNFFHNSGTKIQYTCYGTHLSHGLQTYFPDWFIAASLSLLVCSPPLSSCVLSTFSCLLQIHLRDCICLQFQWYLYFPYSASVCTLFHRHEEAHFHCLLRVVFLPFTQYLRILNTILKVVVDNPLEDEQICFTSTSG